MLSAVERRAFRLHSIGMMTVAVKLLLYSQHFFELPGSLGELILAFQRDGFVIELLEVVA